MKQKEGSFALTTGFVFTMNTPQISSDNPRRCLTAFMLRE